IIKVLFMNENHSYLEGIENDLKEIAEDCDVSYSSNRYLEFNQKGANKGAALEYLTNHLGIDLNKTIAIGDNFNDHSMFKKAGLAVGVRNMREELKDEVDYITDATNDEHAVAETIEKFILNPAKHEK
ncbi:MAG: HAD-IIB family hydrolase, partial [Atopostipes sp.]|nr:HAD-IIB family hydrolase [Atopostipes sp.]